MPCYRCGARQVDPVRGHSPWQRGVRGSRQVLVCPGCQAAPGWASDLDRCQGCGSVRLVRRLGEVECRECGFVTPPDESVAVALQSSQAAPAGVAVRRRSGPAMEAGSESAPGLAEEVALALERVLGRDGRKAPAAAPLP